MLGRGTPERGTMLRRAATLGVLLALLGGCAAGIRVSYLTYSPGTVPTPDLKGLPKFKLASPLVLVETVQDSKTGGVELTFKPVPIEEPGGPTYALLPEEAFGISNRISVTPRPNSMLVHEITTEIEDRRVELIKELGGIIVGAVGKGKADRAIPPLGFQGVVDLASALRESKPSRAGGSVESLLGRKIGSEGEMTIVGVSLSPISADAVEREAFPFSASQSGFVYSACRDVTIELSHQETTYIGTVRIPDPNFVQTVGLPKSGKVSFHDQCGVTVTHGKAVTASSLDLIKTVLEQVKSIREAQDKAAKPSAQR